MTCKDYDRRMPNILTSAGFLMASHINDIIADRRDEPCTLTIRVIPSPYLYSIRKRAGECHLDVILKRFTIY